MAEEEKDDWLEDIDDDEESSAEIDQSDIDSLLTDSDSPASPQEPTVEDESLDEELDQSDIDSLLAGGEATDTPETGVENEDIDGDDLDQSDIDSLLSGDEEDVAAPETPIAATETGGGDDEIDQSDIDALLSGASTSSDEEIPDISPDQEEIDRLFSEIDEDSEEADPFQAEEIDFQDVIDESDDEDSFLSTGNEFEDEEFDLDDDFLDIPDIPGDEEETTVFETKEEPSSPTKINDDIPAEIAPPETAKQESSPESGGKKFRMPEIPIPPVLQERKNQAAAGGILLLLLLLGMWIFSGDDDSAQVADMLPAEKQEMVAQQPPDQPEVTPNTPPMVVDSEFQMETKGPLAIQLTAQDPEGDKLLYEILSQPEHGALKGQAPYLIYVPNKDFPGIDLFNFRVTDGRDFSVPALVKITGKIETKTVQAPAPKKPQTIKPRKLVISAKNFSYNIVGTKAFFIDWEKIWDEANYLPYTNQVAVEILSNSLQGTLHKMSNNMHQYRPKKFSGGQEAIRYRFKLGKIQSKIRNITLTVDPGDPPPEIVLQPQADSYEPGEQILLDAADSMDENRESLLFSWQQIAGVPVQLEVLNKEGSRVAFIAPSSFNTVKTPGPLMRLTIIDKSGKKDVKDIKILTKSRHNNALWGNVAGGRF